MPSTSNRKSQWKRAMLAIKQQQTETTITPKTFTHYHHHHDDARERGTETERTQDSLCVCASELQSNCLCSINFIHSTMRELI